MSGRRLLFAFAALSLLAARPAAAAEAKCQIAPTAELPASMVGLKAQVVVKVNGAETNFVADSGAFYSFMTPEAVERFKLPSAQAPMGFAVGGVGGRDDRVYVATVKEFGLSGSTIKNVQFLVAHGIGSGTSGVLGQNVLFYTDAEYDLGNGIIRLMQPTPACAHANLAYWAAGKSVGDVEIMRTDPLESQIRGEAKINGQTIKVIFDTGSPTTILKRSTAEKLGFRPDGPGVRANGVAHGLGPRVVENWIAPFDSFELGGEEIKHTQLRVADILLGKADMLIGADFFLSHRIYISKLQHHLYFTYSGGPVFRLDRLPEAQVQAEASAPTPGVGRPTSAPVPAETGKYADTPTTAAGFTLRAEASMSRRDFPAALADFTKSIELDPTNPKAYRDRAFARIANRQPMLAMTDFEQALKLKPDDARALMGRAEIYLASRDEAHAQADFDAAVRADPTMALQVAAIYANSLQTDRAVATYDAWIAANPHADNLAVALNGRCWARTIGGHDLDKAMADCDAAIRRGPRTASLFDSRGLTHLRRGENDLAIADYDAALKLQPKLAWSLYGRGLAKRRKGDMAGGDADLRAALEIAPNLQAQARRYGIATPGIGAPSKGAGS